MRRSPKARIPLPVPVPRGPPLLVVPPSRPSVGCTTACGDLTAALPPDLRPRQQRRRARDGPSLTGRCRDLRWRRPKVGATPPRRPPRLQPLLGAVGASLRGADASSAAVAPEAGRDHRPPVAVPKGPHRRRGSPRGPYGRRSSQLRLEHRRRPRFVHPPQPRLNASRVVRHSKYRRRGRRRRRRCCSRCRCRCRRRPQRRRRRRGGGGPRCYRHSARQPVAQGATVQSKPRVVIASARPNRRPAAVPLARRPRPRRVRHHGSGGTDRRPGSCMPLRGVRTGWTARATGPARSRRRPEGAFPVRT